MEEKKSPNNKLGFISINTYSIIPQNKTVFIVSLKVNVNITEKQKNTKNISPKMNKIYSKNYINENRAK